MKQDLYSDIVNLIGNTKVTLCTVWQDTVLIGTGPSATACIDNRRWLRKGDTVEIDGKAWRLTGLEKCSWGVSAQLQLA